MGGEMMERGGREWAEGRGDDGAGGGGVGRSEPRGGEMMRGLRGGE